MRIEQQYLGSQLRKLFQGYDILSNARKDSKIKSPDNTGGFLELDFYIPKLNLAFEYQDPHHYVTTHHAQKSVSTIQQKDELKRQTVNHRGETLVTIPCWWDGKLDSLVSTIRLMRPDLLTNYRTPLTPDASSDPIPAEMPQDYLKVYLVPKVGELMLPSFLDRDTQFDPSKWLISEKYDGVRCCWDVCGKKIYSRYGEEMALHSSLLDCLYDAAAERDEFVDGEIWFGRGQFLNSQEFTKTAEGNYFIQAFVRLIGLDYPPTSQPLSFRERYSLLLQSPNLLRCAAIIIASNVVCKDTWHLHYLASEGIWSKGGEGVVVRDPSALYEHGRSRSAIKFKEHRDNEALVVSKLLTTDDLQYFQLQLPNKITFTATCSRVVASSDEGMMIPQVEVEVGDVVTFEYMGYTANGEPKNAKIIRNRNDVKWSQLVLASSFSDSSKGMNSLKQVLQTPSSMMTNKMEHGHWSQDNNVKVFFDGLAQKYNIDPSNPDHWYQINHKLILTSQYGGSVMQAFGFSIAKVLSSVYPDIGLEEKIFSQRQQESSSLRLRKRGKYWHSKTNRKRMFDKFAEENGFDPLDAKSWYRYYTKDVQKSKARGALKYYKNALSKALLDVYPNIGIATTKYRKVVA